MNNFPDKNSIVDQLKIRGIDSSFNSRKEMYEDIYGGNYTGSAAQNERFNNYVKNNW